MKFIIGKKIDSAQIWKNDEVLSVTRVLAGPCLITQIKTEEKDGYSAVQLGFGQKKAKNIKKPQRGHLRKALGKDAELASLKEFRTEDTKSLQNGDILSVDLFSIGDKVSVAGIAKGKGFQGVVKRHGFKGTKKTHGNKDQLRMPGSIGATGPAHVFKGTRMGGRTGGGRISIKNLEIVEIDIKNNILFIHGAVPGPRSGLLFVSGEGELKVNSQKKEKTNDKEDKDKKKESSDEEKKTVKAEKKK